MQRNNVDTTPHRTLLEKSNRGERHPVKRPDRADRGRARKDPERAATPAGYSWQIREKRNLQAKPVLGRVCDAVVAADAGVCAMGVGTGQHGHCE